MITVFAPAKINLFLHVVGRRPDGYHLLDSLVAFAGVGDPSRFFRTLRANGIEIVEERPFADHHPFSKKEIESLIADAGRDALTLVTTEKDLCRLHGRNDLPDEARQIMPFPVTLEIEGPSLSKMISAWLLCAREKKFTGQK